MSLLPGAVERMKQANVNNVLTEETGTENHI